MASPKTNHLVQLLTRADIAEAEQVSVRTIDRRIAAGLIKTLSWGRTIRIHPDDYNAYLDAHRLTPSPKNNEQG